MMNLWFCYIRENGYHFARLNIRSIARICLLLKLRRPLLASISSPPDHLQYRLNLKLYS